MKAGRVILIIVIVIVVIALTYIIIQLVKKPADTNTPPPVGPGSGGGGNYGGGNNTGGSSGNNNPPPPPAPIGINWNDFKVGDKIFAVLPVDGKDRDEFGYHGYLAKTVKTFAPGAYIGVVKSIIPNSGLMVANTSVANPNYGDPFYILGVSGTYRKG